MKIIGIDIGGSSIKYAVFDENRVILSAIHIGKTHFVIDLVRQIDMILAALTKGNRIGCTHAVDLRRIHGIRQIPRLAVV